MGRWSVFQYACSITYNHRHTATQLLSNSCSRDRSAASRCRSPVTAACLLYLRGDGVAVVGVPVHVLCVPRVGCAFTWPLGVVSCPQSRVEQEQVRLVREHQCHAHPRLCHTHSSQGRCSGAIGRRSTRAHARYTAFASTAKVSGPYKSMLAQASAGLRPFERVYMRARISTASCGCVCAHLHVAVVAAHHGELPHAHIHVLTHHLAHTVVTASTRQEPLRSADATP